MQFISEDRRCGAQLLLVFVLDRCSRKTEEDSAREGLLDREKHFAESGAVAFVHDEDDAFAVHLLDISSIQSAIGFIFNIAHLLDRSHDQRIRRIVAL